MAVKGVVRFEDLADIELTSTSAFRDWTEKYRDLHKAMSWEGLHCAGNMHAALRVLPIVGDPRTGLLRAEISSAHHARRISNLLKRAAEHDLAAGSAAIKAWTLFELNYLETPKRSQQKPRFNVNA
jgi:hypothetical protein